MTLKRKLSLAAVLVVVMGVGFAVSFGGRDSGPPIAVTFIRYEGSNVVVQLTNRSRFVVSCRCQADWAPSLSVLGAPSYDAFLGSHEAQQVRVGRWPSGLLFVPSDQTLSPSATEPTRIILKCLPKQSKVQDFSDRLLRPLGISINRYPEIISLTLPRQNPPP